MAAIIFTDEAKQLARTLIAKVGGYDLPAETVVLVGWSKGVKDNKRGPDGEVVWLTIAPAGWKASLAAWVETPENPIEEHTVEIDGFRVITDTTARTAVGTLIVDALAGTLTVEHRAD